MGYRDTRNKINERKISSQPHAVTNSRVKLISFRHWREIHGSQELYSDFSEYYTFYMTAAEDGKLLGNPSEFKVTGFLTHQAELAFQESNKQTIDTSHVAPMNIKFSKAAIKSIEQRSIVVDYRSVADSILTKEEEKLIEAARERAYVEI